MHQRHLWKPLSGGKGTDERGGAMNLEVTQLCMSQWLTDSTNTNVLCFSVAAPYQRVIIRLNSSNRSFWVITVEVCSLIYCINLNKSRPNEL